MGSGVTGREAGSAHQRRDLPALKPAQELILLVRLQRRQKIGGSSRREHVDARFSSSRFGLCRGDAVDGGAVGAAAVVRRPC